MPSQKPHTATATGESCEKLHADYLDYQQPRKRLMREFTGGVVRGLGMAVGGTIVFGLVAFLLGKFLVIPEARTLIDNLRSEAAAFQQGFGNAAK